MRVGWVYRNNAHPRPDAEGTVTFGARQPRLDRLDNWELISSPDQPAPGADRLVMSPAWADPADESGGAEVKRAPEPDPVGAQLVVISRPARRPRKGTPPATIEGTALSPKVKGAS